MIDGPQLIDPNAAPVRARPGPLRRFIRNARRSVRRRVRGVIGGGEQGIGFVLPKWRCRLYLVEDASTNLHSSGDFGFVLPKMKIDYMLLIFST
jgi:hypothetical protein